MKFLIVDDFPTMRRVVKTLLRQNGYSNFVEADNAEEGMSQLEQNQDVDLIVSTWQLTKGTATDFEERVRNDNRFSAVPILYVASEEDRESVTLATQRGQSEMIVKPFTGQALQDKLDRVFANFRKKAI